MARTEDIKITALYERLSRDDEQVGESNSIQNHDVMYRGWNTPKNITYQKTLHHDWRLICGE